MTGSTSDSHVRSGGGDEGRRPLRAISDHSDLGVVDALAGVHVVITRWRVAHHLTANEFAVLLQVHAQRRVTSTKLSSDIGLSLPSTGKLLESLERDGWVTRIRDQSDRRRTIVQPSKRLVRAMLDLVDALRAFHDE